MGHEQRIGVGSGETVRSSSGALLEVAEVGESLYAAVPVRGVRKRFLTELFGVLAVAPPPIKKRKVLPACADKTGGHWACLTHAVSFDTPLSKDFHISASAEEWPVHRMVWCCYEHGPEKP